MLARKVKQLPQSNSIFETTSSEVITFFILFIEQEKYEKAGVQVLEFPDS